LAIDIPAILGGPCPGTVDILPERVLEQTGLIIFSIFGAVSYPWITSAWLLCCPNLAITGVHVKESSRHNFSRNGRGSVGVTEQSNPTRCFMQQAQHAFHITTMLRGDA
jgi:hypothetical protein